MKNLAVTLMALLCSMHLFAQPGRDSISSVFELGEVVVTGKEQAVSQTISSDKIDLLGKKDVASALNLLPGVNFSLVGARNEAMIYVRGFDLRQVPVFVDGMPVYVPYDGYLDLARFSAWDISGITVSGGNSSLLYGANSLGGAINIVSTQPVSAFEISGNLGTDLSSEGMNSREGAVTLGTRHKMWYMQGSFSILDRDFLFVSQNAPSQYKEDGEKRDNSDTRDISYRFKAGFTPGKGNEYVVTYSGVRAEKGVPVYLGDNTSTKVRYWRYPDWNKDCIYLHSRTRLSEKNFLRGRFFYDSYYNVLDSYDDNTYSTQTKSSAFTSIYDDYSLGGAVELAVSSIDRNALKLAVNEKYDLHSEHNVGDPKVEMADNTFTVALEDTYTLSDKFAVNAGIGYFSRNSIKAEEYNSTSDTITDFADNDDGTFNYQASLYFTPSKDQKISLAASRKSRFATMKDRYSYKMGKAIPNPDLKAECAWNYELSYEATIHKNLQLYACLFYSHIKDAIQEVDDVEPGVYQLQNTGKANFKGLEIKAGWLPFRNLSLGAGYDYLSRKNKSNPDIWFTDVPKNRLSGYISYVKPHNYSVVLDTEYDTRRLSESTGTYWAPEYTVFNLKAEKYFLHGLKAEAGIYNLFDKSYFYSEGYPAEGRIFHLALAWKFNQ